MGKLKKCTVKVFVDNGFYTTQCGQKINKNGEFCNQHDPIISKEISDKLISQGFPNLAKIYYNPLTKEEN